MCDYERSFRIKNRNILERTGDFFTVTPAQDFSIRPVYFKIEIRTPKVCSDSKTGNNYAPI